ncbi:MAG: ABC transporter permease [Bacteroidetes bacterium]|nr:ABC transporter permease [Bacteroidota bacterium]
MQVLYVLREGFSGFKRTKVPMIIAIVTISISLLLLSFFAILLFNVEALIEEIRSKVELETFLSEYLSDEEVVKLKAQIERIDGVKEVQYISKEDAAQIFYDEFGEDIYKVLNFNPLPASFKIKLYNEYKTLEKVQSIYYKIKTIKGVDDVIYRKKLLEVLDQQARGYLWILFGIGVFVALSAILLVANTIRLTIYAKRTIIQTMKLIGATRGFIRTPFIIEGLLQGFCGGLIAVAVVFLVVENLQTFLTVPVFDLIKVKPYYYVVILSTGCFLGVLGSLISVRRFIKTTVVQ